MASDTSISAIQLIKSNIQQNALQNGSNVFVRVLSKGMGNEYIVSFAGNKFNVTSQRQLLVGTAFGASVTIKGGKVFLSPQMSSYQNNVQKFSVADTNSLGNLSSFLQELGLKADGISLRLIQYFQSAGFSFNTKLANKARSIGLQFPGKEEDAAEIALFLEQKGIRADTNSVMELLGVIYGDNFHQNDEGKDDEEEQDEEGKQNKEQEIIHVETLVSSLKEKNDIIDSEQTSILNAIYNDATKALNRKGSLLTLLNHHHTTSSHWVILPFEGEANDLRMSGTIRLLVDLNKKNTEKMIIYAFLGGNNYKCMIKYVNRGVSANQQRYSIQICTDKQETEQSSEYLCALLRSCLPKDLDCDVSYSKDLENDGIFTLGSVISVVKLDV